MSEQTLTLLCAFIGSGVSVAIVNGIFSRIAASQRKETGESQGMKWLLQDRLEHLARHFLEQGTISYEELKNWNRGHAIYHDLLEGNGDLNALKQALHNLYQRGEQN